LTNFDVIIVQVQMSFTKTKTQILFFLNLYFEFFISHISHLTQHSTINITLKWHHKNAFNNIIVLLSFDDCSMCFWAHLIVIAPLELIFEIVKQPISNHVDVWMIYYLGIWHLIIHDLIILWYGKLIFIFVLSNLLPLWNLFWTQIFAHKSWPNVLVNLTWWSTWNVTSTICSQRPPKFMGNQGVWCFLVLGFEPIFQVQFGLASCID
jgi:hypothetical protein